MAEATPPGRRRSQAGRRWTAGPALARTTYLHVNYRSITPAERDLRVTARLVRVSGRKRLVTGEIYDGAALCCDAEGLFVELRPGQPKRCAAGRGNCGAGDRSESLLGRKISPDHSCCLDNNNCR